MCFPSTNPSDSIKRKHCATLLNNKQNDKVSQDSSPAIGLPLHHNLITGLRNLIREDESPKRIKPCINLHTRLRFPGRLNKARVSHLSRVSFLLAVYFAPVCYLIISWSLWLISQAREWKEEVKKKAWKKYIRDRDENTNWEEGRSMTLREVLD